MDFTLSKKHEMARTLFKEFAENEVKPLAQETDENEQFPVETVEKMAKYGFLGIPVPKEYGGQGCDVLTYVMCVEELSKVCGTTGVIVSAHTSLCIDPIMTYGTEEQKQKYVKPLATGEKLVHLHLLSREQELTLREHRQRLYLTEMNGFLMVQNALLPMVKRLTYILLLLLQALQRISAEERRRISQHLSLIRMLRASHSEQRKRKWVYVVLQLMSLYLKTAEFQRRIC